MGENVQGKKTKEKLIQVALKCLVHEGVHNISFQSIADKCGLDRPLVIYHFKKLENIFPIVWDHIYSQALKQTEDRVKDSGSAVEKLINYIRVSIEFFTQKKEITIIYLQLHYLAAFDPKLRQVNTLIKRRAVKRVTDIIIEGQRHHEFRTNVDPKLTAKAIHSSLVGVLLNSVTEYEDFELDKIVGAFSERVLTSLMIK